MYKKKRHDISINFGNGNAKINRFRTGNISSHWPNTEQWKSDEIHKIFYLKQFFQEIIRLLQK